MSPSVPQYLADLEARIVAIERSRVLANASLDNTALPVYDNDGQIRLVVGALPDGTFGTASLNSPAPPVPAAPTAMALAAGGVTVLWTGQTTTGAAWPSDLDRVDIILSTTTAFAAADVTVVGAFTSTTAARKTFAALTAGTTYYVALQAVNKAGAASALSGYAAAVPGSVVSPAELEALADDIEEALTSITNDLVNVGQQFFNNVSLGDPVPVGESEHDIWFRPDNGYALYQWKPAAPSDPVLLKWVKNPLGTAAFVAQSITTELLAEDAVTVAKLAANSVTFRAIADGAVGIDSFASDAQKALAAASAQNYNPTFSDWTGTYPGGFASFGSVAPAKETTVFRTGPNAVRLTTPINVDSGLDASTSFSEVPYSRYVTLECDVYLVTGTFEGAGIKLVWGGTSRYALFPFNGVTSLATGKWYRFTRTLKDPNPAGSFTSFSGIVAASQDELGARTAKDIIVDRVSMRAATAAEITAYDSGIKLSDWSATDTTKIDGAKIYTSSIIADSLGAGIVSSKHLTVGAVSDNLAVNGGYDEWDNSTKASDWVNDVSAPYAGATYARVFAPTALSGTYSPTMIAASTKSARTSMARAQAIAVGEKVHVSFLTQGSSAVTNGVQVEIAWYTDADVYISSSTQTWSLSTTAARYFVVGTAPATAARFRAALVALPAAAGVTLTYDSCEIRKLIGGALIADASIITAHISDASITNAKIANLEASKIDTGFLNAARIQAGSLSASKIDATTITADFLRSNGAFIGALQAENITSITVTGSLFRTAASGQRMEIRSDTAAGIIRAYTGHVTETAPGYIDPGAGSGVTTGDGYRARVEIASPNFGRGAAIITATSAYSSSGALAAVSTNCHVTVPSLNVSGSFDAGSWGNTPAGVMMMFAGSGTPTGWLRCDGSAVPKSSYPALYAAIGGTWGETSTTFNLPDMRDRAPHGAGATWALGGNEGSAYGARNPDFFSAGTITFPTGVQAHSHGIDSATLSHSGINVTGGAHNHDSTSAPSGTTTDIAGGGAKTAAGAAHTHSVGSPGSSHSHSITIDDHTHAHGGSTQNNTSSFVGGGYSFSSTRVPGAGVHFIIRAL